jgi:hypothetical protein
MMRSLPVAAACEIFSAPMVTLVTFSKPTLCMAAQASLAGFVVSRLSAYGWVSALRSIAATARSN